MEQESPCQSEPAPNSDESELDENDSAFAKTPIRPEEDDDASSIASDMSSVSSDASVHFNERGDKTYFHVWSDMLTCNEMVDLDKKAETEEPNYVEGDEVNNPNIHKPLSIDTSLPCPLIQFGPIPKARRPGRKIVESKPQIEDQVSEVAGDSKLKDDVALLKEEDNSHFKSDSNLEAASGVEPACCSAEGHADGHEERCCDFSVVAAKNKARLKMEARMRRLEKKRLVRY